MRLAVALFLFACFLGTSSTAQTDLELQRQEFRQLFADAQEALYDEGSDATHQACLDTLEFVEQAELEGIEVHPYLYQLLFAFVPLYARDMDGAGDYAKGERIMIRLEAFLDQVEGRDLICYFVYKGDRAISAGRTQLAAEWNRRALELTEPPAEWPRWHYLQHYAAYFVEAGVQRARILLIWGKSCAGAEFAAGHLAEIEEMERQAGEEGPIFHESDVFRLRRLIVSLRDNCRGRADGREESIAEIRELLDYSRSTDADLSRVEIFNLLSRLANHLIAMGEFAEAEAALREAESLTFISGDRPIARLFEASLRVRLIRLSSSRGVENDQDQSYRAASASLLERLDSTFSAWEGLPEDDLGTAFLRYDRQRLGVSEAILYLMASEEGSGGGIPAALGLVERLGRLGTVYRDLVPSESEGEIESDWLREIVANGRTGVVVFLRGYDSTHVISVDAEGSLYDEVPLGDGVFEARVRDFRRRLLEWEGEDASAELMREAEALFDTVFPGPIGSRAQSWERLCIVDRDSLFGLEVEALRGNDEWLGLSHAISDVPSLPLLRHLSRSATSQEDSDSTQAAGLLEVVADRPNGGLPTFKMETEGSWPGPRMTLSREAATPTALLSALDGSSPFALHLVAHGDLDRMTIEQRAALVLFGDSERPDGRLRYEDISNMRLPGLVALIACGGRRGELLAGDSSAGQLNGAAFRGGALSVILSPHDLLASAHPHFWSAFSSALFAGLSCDEALREGNRRLAEIGYSPGVWARYQLSGFGGLKLHPSNWVRAQAADHRIPFGAPAQVLLASGLLALTVWWIRRRFSRERVSG